MEELKQIIAKNLIKYRKNAKLTQLELADKLMYSDKNISKWERAEAVPDVLILKTLADLYNISVNDFLVEKDGIETTETMPRKNKSKLMNRKQILITLLSISLVWLVATVSFGIMINFEILHPHAWKNFIVAVPISVIVTLVFTSNWCTNLANCIVVGFLIWTSAVAIYLCVNVTNIWLIFIVAIPLQILDVLWFVFRKINKNFKFIKQISDKKVKHEKLEEK